MADKPEKKIDPNDVEALEKSLNDSATRVSTIWVSFLIFSLYLLTAATTVTHRQLFLAEPVKLPVLNIDLPLWGFFFLAPILFVVFHVYVLIQIILLARTAAAYNEAVDQQAKVDADNARIRQRLANTLFAQIFAGSPRERDGWLGWLLRAMALITLAAAPILILLAFQFMFLPYHSHFATWTHRFLVFAEIIAVFGIWPLVLDPNRDFKWRIARRQMVRTALFPVWLLSPWDPRRFQWTRVRGHASFLASSSAVGIASLFAVTFPGEPHINLATGRAWTSVQCDRWLAQRYDRLHLPRIDVVDDDKLAKIEAATKEKDLLAFQGERTRDFRDRDLRCANLEGGDFRRADFTNAKMFGVQADSAELQGAVLDRVELQSASLVSAKLQGAAVRAAELQNANLLAAHLSSAVLVGSDFSSANLSSASLIAAVLNRATFSGATLSRADLRFASTIGTYFYGSDLSDADLRGAEFAGARMQVTQFGEARLDGADFNKTHLQGSDLSKSNVILATFSGANLWHTKVKDCARARVQEPKFESFVDARIGDSGTEERVAATAEAIEELIDNAIQHEPDPTRQTKREILRTLFGLDQPMDDHADQWRVCASEGPPDDEHHKQRGQLLLSVICSSESDQVMMIEAVSFNVMSRLMEFDLPTSRIYLETLSAGLIGMTDKTCAGISQIRGSTRRWLEQYVPKPGN